MDEPKPYAPPPDFKGFAKGSLILAAFVLAVFILQQIGIIPMSPF